MDDLYYLIEGTKSEEFYGEYEWSQLDEELLQEDINRNDKN
jgi:hypothetical protein